MGNLFSNMLLKASSWLFKQSLGGKRGTDALAHSAPLLSVVSAAAGNAASVQIDHAAATNGNLAAVLSLVSASQGNQ